MPLTMDPDKMFGEEPVQVQCSNCQQMATTRVEASVSSEGWMFGICCCLFGSWITSLLVITMCHYKYVSIRCLVTGVLPPWLQTVRSLLPDVQCSPGNRQAQPHGRPHRPHCHPLPHHHGRGGISNLRQTYNVIKCTFTFPFILRTPNRGHPKDLKRAHNIC